MSYISTNGIGGLYLGNTEIQKAYLGTNLVYQKNDAPEFYPWLLFDGTAYIETDIIPWQDMSVTTGAGGEPNDGPSKYLLCYSATGGTKTRLFETSATNTTTAVWCNYYNSSSSLVSKDIYQYYPRHDLFMTPKVIGFSSASNSTFTKGNGTPNGPIIFGATEVFTNMYDGGLYTTKLYGSDAENVTSIAGFADYTPQIILRPCIYKGESGLWNVEQNKFYGNSAESGTLQAANILSLNPSSYDTVNKSYYSIANMSNAYTAASSGNYVTINLARGSGTETYVYFKFDTSALPANATIHRVNCTARYYISNTGSGNITSRQIQMFSGTTAKNTAATMSTTLTGRTLPNTTWTREELNDVRVRVYAKRGSSNTSAGYVIRFYGAVLDIYYT